MQHSAPLEGGLGFKGTLTIRRFKAGQLVYTSAPLSNKVVSSTGYGRNLILKWMSGDTTYPIVIDSIALGDDDTAAVDADAALGNELVADIPLTNIVVANNVATFDVFVADDNLPDDTYKEFGVFAGGRLIARVVITPNYTKATGEDTLFTYTLTSTG